MCDLENCVHSLFYGWLLAGFIIQSVSLYGKNGWLYNVFDLLAGGRIGPKQGYMERFNDDI